MGPHAKTTIHIGFFLQKDLVDKLDAIAADDKRTRSSYLRLLVERHVTITRRPRGHKPGTPADRRGQDA